MKIINFTFGSRYIINKIIKRNYKRKLIPFYSIDQNDNIILIDFSNQKSIFKNPITYKVNNYIINSNYKNFINITSMILNEDDSKQIKKQFDNLHYDKNNNFNSIYLLESIKNPLKKMVISFWNNKNNYYKWINNYNSLNIKKYNSINNFYYQKNYSLLY